MLATERDSMASDEIRSLQFLVCQDFTEFGNDGYTAHSVHSNIIVSEFPYLLDNHFAITCWRKDARFHKEVIEYSTDYGLSYKSPHMDIEPVTDSVFFRWHKHPFPSNFAIDRNTLLTIKVILDWKVYWETYLMIEKINK